LPKLKKEDIISLMKADIHPKWYPEAKVTCACGNTFTVGATLPEITVGICSNCHPFYTGQLKFVDTTGRVEKFRVRQAAKTTKKVSKTEKRKLKKQRQIEEERERPDTLSALRAKA